MAIQSITTEALQDTLQAATDDKLLDVRESDEYASGHISEAVNFPLSTLEENLSKLDSNEHYYIICQKGGRSMKASELLNAKGFEVTNVAGGMDDWRGEVVY